MPPRRDGGLPQGHRWLANRRQWLMAAAGCSLLPAVKAGVYPDRLITFVVPFTAGSAPDTFARALTLAVSRAAAVPAITDNRPGAGSVLAVQAVMRAAPDGYTVLITGNVAITGNVHVMKRPGYDPAADLTPVTPLSRGPMVLYVNPAKLAARSAGDLVPLLRDGGAVHAFGYTSITSRLPAELLQQTLGVRLTGVPYRSGNAALPDLVSGRIDLLFTDLSAMPHVASGRLRALGVTGVQRSPHFPELPTLAEAGLPGIDVGFWLGAYLPAKAPPAVVAALHALLLQAVKSADAQAALKAQGASEFVLPIGGLASFQAQETAAWGRIIHAAGIQPE